MSVWRQFARGNCSRSAKANAVPRGLAFVEPFHLQYFRIAAPIPE
jgi:hypothetical protein